MKMTRDQRDVFFTEGYTKWFCKFDGSMMMLMMMVTRGGRGRRWQPMEGECTRHDQRRFSEQSSWVLDDEQKQFQRSVTFSWSAPSKRRPSEEPWITFLFFGTTWPSQLGSSFESRSAATTTRVWSEEDRLPKTDDDFITTCSRTFSEPEFKSWPQSQQQPPEKERRNIADEAPNTSWLHRR